MSKTVLMVKNILIFVVALCVCFVICLVIQNVFENDALIPAIFVLGVFLISALTDGYWYGLAASVVSVVAVNYAFTFPFFKINFTITQNLTSAVIMIVIAFITSGFTTRIKYQEYVKAESEKEKMRANLLRAVSHDLRTPLTTIYGASSALLDDENDFSREQTRQMLQGIQSDSQWLHRMVENLLSITKLDGKNVEIIKTPTALDELVDSVLLKFDKRYPGYEVIADIPDELVLIPMDALLIEQVIINLLENAVCHAEGMDRLSLKVFVIADKVIFEVKDNGCGIPKEKLKNIFSGCYTSDASSPDSKKSNAGIGLAVCATIIKAHGGDITADNLKNGGAVFRFTLDMEELDGEQ